MGFPAALSLAPALLPPGYTTCVLQRVCEDGDKTDIVRLQEKNWACGIVVR